MNDTQPLTKQGKANKRELIRQVLREEIATGKPIEYKRVILIASKRLEQYPAQQRSGLCITEIDVKNARSNLNRQGMPVKAAERRTSKAIAAPVDPVTLPDLQNARRYLSDCGGSIAKAHLLIDALSTLIGE